MAKLCGSLNPFIPKSAQINSFNFFHRLNFKFKGTEIKDNQSYLESVTHMIINVYQYLLYGGHLVFLRMSIINTIWSFFHYCIKTIS